MEPITMDMSFYFEREVELEYFVSPECTGGSHPDSGDTERIPASVELYAVKVPVYKHGKETEEKINIINLLSPDEVQGIRESIIERGGLE